MTKKINLNILNDGPIQISGFDSINFCGEKLDSVDKAFLCRCGNSKNAPYCDGSHRTNGFSGINETTEQQAIRVWQGKTIQTHFNSNLCMHARKCKSLGDLRKLESEEGSANAAREIAKIVTTCPSGALSYDMVDSVNAVEFESSGNVEIVEGGEIQLSCDLESNGVEFQERQPANRVTLCRCGLSKNKPFCDASHSNKENFR